MRSVSYRSVHAKPVIESPRFGLVFNQFRRFSALSATTIEGKQMCRFCEEQGSGTDPLSENRECPFKHEKPRTAHHAIRGKSSFSRYLSCAP